MLKIVVDTVAVWDVRIFHRIFNLNGKKALDGFMYLLSRLGDGYFYGFIGALLPFIDRNAAVKVIPAGLLAFALELSVYKILKSKTKRFRPFEKIPGIRCLLPPPDRYSFPSGHSGAAFLMATLFGTLAPIFFVPLFILAGLIGFSRIYNGLHFPSDVIMGMTLGITCAKIGVGIFF